MIMMMVLLVGWRGKYTSTTQAGVVLLAVLSTSGEGMDVSEVNGCEPGVKNK